MLPLSVNFNKEDGRLVTDPERLAVETLERILREAGIAIRSEPMAQAESQPQKLLTFHSPPLRELVADINKVSNNFMVEMLIKHFGGGAWPQGVLRIQMFCSSLLGLGADKIVLTDGSGLSKENRLSARTLAIVLRAAWNDFEVGPEMVELPEGHRRRALEAAHQGPQPGPKGPLQDRPPGRRRHRLRLPPDPGRQAAGVRRPPQRPLRRRRRLGAGEPLGELA